MTATSTPQFPSERDRTAGAPSDPYETIATTIARLRQRRRLLIVLPLLTAVITAGISFTIPHRYSATAAFVPEAPSDLQLPAGMAGIANQFGLGLGGQASLSPAFYVSIIRGRVLMERALRSGYPDPRPGAGASDSTTLMTLLDAGGDNLLDSLERAIKTLRKHVRVDIENRTDILHVTVEARYASLAAGVANRLLTLVSEFNGANRRSRGGERRLFLEGRVRAAEGTLHIAEDSLEAFMETNRLWQQSPNLVFAEGRLRRQVDIQQQVLVTLMREYETAALEEVDDTPVITVVEPAIQPAKRTWPRRKILVGLAWFLGTLLVGLWIMVSDHVFRILGVVASRPVPPTATT